MTEFLSKFFKTTTVVETLPDGGKSVSNISFLKKSYSLIPGHSIYLSSVK